MENKERKQVEEAKCFGRDTEKKEELKCGTCHAAGSLLKIWQYQQSLLNGVN